MPAASPGRTPPRIGKADGDSPSVRPTPVPLPPLQPLSRPRPGASSASASAGRPTASALTRMPSSANSSAIHCMSPTRPNCVAECTPRPTMPARAACEVRKRIEPPAPASTMRSAASRLHVNAALRSLRSAPSHTSASVSSSGPPGTVRPATIRTSSRPKRSMVCSTTERAAASSARSPDTAKAPLSGDEAAVWECRATPAPSAISFAAMACPKPA